VQIVEKVDCVPKACDGKPEAGRPCNACSQKSSRKWVTDEFSDGCCVTLAECAFLSGSSTCGALLVLAAELPIPQRSSLGAQGRQGDPGHPVAAMTITRFLGTSYSLDEQAGGPPLHVKALEA
jgi:hypothetical protein